LISLDIFNCLEVGTPYAISSSSEIKRQTENIMSATLHTNGHLNTMGLPVVDFAHIEQAAITAARTLKNVALFAAAPFIGLVYAMALPLVGLVMLAAIAARAVAKTNALATLKNVGLLLAAPFVGLAYAVALPFVGIALIGKTGYEAYKAQAN
jgi:hypothetical protein